jgi:hypothetical protein
MKYSLVLFILLSALQPLQAQGCDMDGTQESGHHATMAEEGDHDCCDTDEDSTQHGCVDAVSCGTCAVVLTPPPADSGASGLTNGQRFTVFDESGIAAPHSHPPFRPPIA